VKNASIGATILFMVIGLAAVSISSTAAADVEKVAIIPFTVNADRDLGFLQKGLVDMLSTRLNHPGKVVVIDRAAVMSALAAAPAVDARKAKEIGGQLGARYILFGSLTSIGKAISVDARAVDVSGVKPATTFFAQAETLGAVIPEINRLAEKINRQLLGIQLPASAAQAAASSPEASRRINPEKLLAQPSQMASSALEPVGSQKTGQFVEAIHPQSGTFWRSRTFTHMINGIAMGDVTGDGRTELVAITDHRALIYRFEGKQLVKIGEAPKNRAKNYIGVDIGDINGNGRPEIFITALNTQRNRVESLVLEYDGQKFQPIIKNSPWYYRVSTSPDAAPILLGQKPVDEDPFKTAVFDMQWSGNDYKPGHRVVPRKRGNALGCVAGNLLNDGRKTMAAFSDDDAIQIFDDRGELLITEDDDFGGNLLSVTLPVSDPGNPPPVKYLPLRLLIRDLNNDGKNELVTVRSDELTGKHLSRFRKFNRGQFVGLTWDGAGLAETWRTRKLSGRVADFAVGDLDGDGGQDLVAVLVAREGRVIGIKPRVNIIVYPLGASKQ